VNRRDSGFRRERIARQRVSREQAERPEVIPDEADEGPAQDNGSDAANPVTTGHGDAASQSRKRRRCRKRKGSDSQPAPRRQVSGVVETQLAAFPRTADSKPGLLRNIGCARA